MRRLIAIEFLSVDGVMQGLGSPDEDREGGFEHGGWGAPYAEAIHASTAAGGLGGTTAYLFGRRTYEKMAAFWPTMPDENPMAAHLNATEKHVVTRSVATFDWGNTRPLAGDVADGVRALKRAGDGDIAILGSGVLVRSLLRADLIDGMRLFVHPLLLGSGKRLFGELEAPRPLVLTGFDTTSMGSLVLAYDVEHAAGG
ncbi:dihydrofolate reductase family protein [Agromyces endophyticus]|uniref:dihydrofolate reductase family protein n=1 Tax=Agromyces sp. H17E-10 TaxID=2932244 RepID=UPI001FD4C466|nr:dihydrofolate reductase family protein [Agromyces sp. H17E-10]UOQ87739.1 dihydrofolate reductase family protein [Agromyces sp. H17E-10]